MIYIDVTTRPDIIFVLHQCTKYNVYPKQSREKGDKSIRRYLKGKKDKVLVFTPDGSNGLECCADADFS